MNSFSPVWRADLRLRPSRLFLALSLALHLAAMVAVFASNLSVWSCLALVVALAISFCLSWWQELRKDGLIVRERENDWWLQDSAPGGCAELRRSQVWRYLVVMDFAGRDEGRCWRRRVVLLPDAVAPDAFRRLRVRLRYRKSGRGRKRSAHGFLQRPEQAPQ